MICLFIYHGMRTQFIGAVLLAVKGVTVLICFHLFSILYPRLQCGFLGVKPIYSTQRAPPDFMIVQLTNTIIHNSKA